MEAASIHGIRTALRTVRREGAAGDIVGEGLVENLTLSPSGVARIVLKTEGLSAAESSVLVAAATRAVNTIEGVARAVVVATGARRQGAPQAPRQGGHADPLNVGKGADKQGLARVRKIIAVASGKGGVGKSTIAANLACALARAGWRTGLLDADIYGPSLPVLFGLRAEQPAMRDGLIAPVARHGVVAMSIGLLVSEEKSLAWRGPMVMGAVRQLMNDVDWGDLDILVVDTPPGTGDAHLTLAQMKRLDGAVIVSTPQEMALADVRRGVEFFRKTGVNVLGVVENMSWLEGPDGARIDIFGEGGARRAAAALGAPFLGELPLFPDLRAASDAGAPPAAQGGGPIATAFDALAARLAADLGL